MWESNDTDTDLNADKHSLASSARSTKRRVRGCLCQWELKAPTDRFRSDCVHEQVAKLGPVSTPAGMDCECPLYTGDLLDSVKIYPEVSGQRGIEHKMTEKLSNPKKTIEVIQKHGFDFQKKFGQNFLIDSHVLEKIVGAAEITKDDFVLEIGPGIGTLTQYLAEAAREVTAVEIDRNLIPILGETLSDYSNVTIINEDVLKLDLAALANEKNGGKPIKVVANLPYYITTPIIMGLFESRVPLKSITIMVQKEVADRMQVGPGTKDYGALSLAVQYYAKPEIVANVPPNCFIPRPNVGSAVIRLTRYEEPPVKVKDEKKMFSLIRASFNQRRKTLVNGLGNAGLPGITKESASAALEQMGLSPTVRGEALTLEQFAQLSDLI